MLELYIFSPIAIIMLHASIDVAAHLERAMLETLHRLHALAFQKLNMNCMYSGTMNIVVHTRISHYNMFEHGYGYDDQSALSG